MLICSSWGELNRAAYNIEFNIELNHTNSIDPVKF